MRKVILGTNETSAWPHFAGSIWARLQYLFGIERLGFEAFWVDRLAPIDPQKREHNLHGLDYLVDRFRRTARDFGFEDRYCIVYNEGERCFGLGQKDLARLVDDADLLINISGRLPPRSELLKVTRKAYIDVDPG